MDAWVQSPAIVDGFWARGEDARRGVANAGFLAGFLVVC